MLIKGLISISKQPRYILLFHHHVFNPDSLNKMVDVNIISTTPEVFNLYLKQKTEFHFTQKSDNDFMLFLLDTAVRVISIGKEAKRENELEVLK